MRIFVRVVTVATVVWFSATQAAARVWRVERDGSGDFGTIQPAVDAAAPGDTMIIGPGRYLEDAPFSTVGSPTDTYVGVAIDNLTIRGVDAGAVVIGPDVADFRGFGPQGIATSESVTSLRVEQLTLQNTYEGCFVAAGGAEIRRCAFKGTYPGVLALTPDGILVEQCLIQENPGGMALLEPSGIAHILECRFVGPGGGLGVQQGRAARVTRRESIDLSIALLCADGGAAVVEDCDFHGATYASIDI